MNARTDDDAGLGVSAFFDTSVLVAAFFEDHEHHEASLRVFSEATKESGFCAAHTLAELFATTTRFPGRQRLSADQALLLLENVTNRLTIIHLDGQEYVAAIEQAAFAGVTGGTVYDVLILACANKVKARLVYTWNLKHFQRLPLEIAERVQSPI